MTDGSAARGLYRKGRERRQAIVDAAVTLFAEKGYTAGSMRELAGRVGLTQTGLLHYFKDKSELLTEVIEARDRSVAASLGGVEITDPVEYSLAIARHAQANPGLTALFTVLSAEASMPGHPAHDYFADRYRGMSASVAEENHRAQVAGRVRGDIDPRLLASIVISVLDGVQLQRAYSPDLDPEAVLAALWKLLGGAEPEA